MVIISFRHLFRITSFFLFIKSLQILIVFFTTEQFDTSSQIVFQDPSIIKDKSIFINKVVNIIIKNYVAPEALLRLTLAKFNYGTHEGDLSVEEGSLIYRKAIKFILEEFYEKLVVWDAVYFTKNFLTGPTYEHEWIFGPLWWKFIKNYPSKYLYPSNEFTELLCSNNFYSKLILSTFFTNLFHYFSILVLYLWTSSLFENPENKFSSSQISLKKTFHEISLKTSLLYVLNPAGIFLVAPYSESFAALLTFTGLYLREASFSKDNTFFRNPKIFHGFLYVLSSFFIAFGVMVRSNIILVGYVYFFDFINSVLQKKFFKLGIFSLISGLIVFMGWLSLITFPYDEFCPERKVWCDNLIFPSYLSFVQSHYWNVGFLKYWTFNNIPNFLIALPIISTLIISSNYLNSRFFLPELRPLIHMSTIFLFLGITCFHIQILNRISGFIPLPYWFLSLKLIESKNRDQLVGRVYGKKNSSKKSFFRIENIIIFWMILYIFIQSSLFAGFLPPA